MALLSDETVVVCTEGTYTDAKLKTFNFHTGAVLGDLKIGTVNGLSVVKFGKSTALAVAHR